MNKMRKLVSMIKPVNLSIIFSSCNITFYLSAKYFLQLLFKCDINIIQTASRGIDNLIFYYCGRGNIYSMIVSVKLFLKLDVSNLFPSNVYSYSKWMATW